MRGRPVTGSVPEFIRESVRARRIRERATSVSLASTLPSRLMSHFRINSSREGGGTCAAAGGKGIASTPHQASTSQQVQLTIPLPAGSRLGIIDSISGKEWAHCPASLGIVRHQRPKHPGRQIRHAVAAAAPCAFAAISAAIRAAAAVASSPACSTSRAATWQCTAWPSTMVAGGSIWRQTCSAKGQRG